MMLSLLDSKRVYIIIAYIYMTIVAAGYGLRENRRQRFLIFVFQVPNDLKSLGTWKCL